MAAKVGMLNAVLSANTSQFKAGMREASASAKKFSKSIEAQNRKLRKLGKQLTKTGKEISLKLALPIAALGVLATKTFAGFEQEMAKVKAISGATGKTFSDLQKLAEDLGASTRFTASEVATLELNYSKLGFAPAEIQKITAATLDLALATGEDLAESAQVAGATLRGFGKQASEMPAIIDVMALSFSSSALNLEKFKDSMKTVAPVAKAANASLEETTAILSVLVDSGLDASTAGTSLRNIFLDLADKGLSWNDAMGKIRNSTNKLKTAQNIFNKRSSTAALLISENSDKLETLTDKYNKAAGAAKRMAAIMDDTLEGAFLKVKSAVEAVGIEFGRRLAPILTVIAEKAASVAGWFKNLEPATKDVILVVGALAIAVGPLLIALGFLASTILPALITGFALLTGPIGLVVLGIAALAGGYLLFSRNAGEAATKQEVLNDVMIDARKAAAAEGAELERLLKIGRDNTKSLRERDIAIRKINEISPEYLGNIRLENINSQETTAAVLAHKDAIIAKAKAQILAKKNAALALEIAEKEFELEEGFATVMKRGINIAKQRGITVDELNKSQGAFNGFLEKTVDEVKDENKELKILNERMNTLSELLTEVEGKELKIKVPTVEITPSFFKLDTSKLKVKEKFKIDLEVESNIESFETALLRFNDTILNASKKTAEEVSQAWGNAMNELDSITREVASVIGQVWSGLSNVFAQTMRNDEIALENRHSVEMRLLEESILRIQGKQAILNENFEMDKERLLAFSDALDEEFEKEKERILQSIATKEEKDKAILKLQEKFDKKMQASIKKKDKALLKLQGDHADGTMDIENEIAGKKKALDDKIAKEKKDLAQKRAQTDKAAALIGAVVNTALAVTGALAAIPGPGGIALALIVGALGAIEIGLIEGQPTALAEGGIVTRPTIALIGEAGPEAVIPLKNFQSKEQDQKMELVTKVSGEDLFFVLKRFNHNLSFIS